MAEPATKWHKGGLILSFTLLSGVWIGSLVPTGTAGASTPTTVTPGPSAPCRNSQFHAKGRPASLVQTLRAIPLPPTPSSLSGFQSPGTSVPKSNIETSAPDGNGLLFGLAVYDQFNEVTYPAISTDRGATWQIDGPFFWVAAADGAGETHNIGALGGSGAYFWGQGGNVVKVTTDKGLHWWATGFAGGVDKVSASKGILHTIALGDQASCSTFEAFSYVSKNSGHTWTLQGRVRNARL